MPSSSSSPLLPAIPYWLRWIFHLLLNDSDRASALGDLGELYQLRLARDGQRATDCWLHRQWRQYPFRLIAERFRRSTGLQPSPLQGEPRRSEEPVQNLYRDLCHSLRSLGRTPGLSATIIATVGLGIGATTAIFAVVNGVLIQPLPYPQPDRLVKIYTASGANRYPLSVADYLALEEQQTSFDQVAGYGNTTFSFNQGDTAERTLGRRVTWTYFPLLGHTPLHGRLLNASDDLPGAPPVAVVSHSFFSRHLEGDPGAVGKTIRLDGVETTVIGVLGSKAGALEQGKDIFTAAGWDLPPRKGPFFITALGRRLEDVSLTAATEELRAINRRLFPVWQESYDDQQASWGAMDLKEAVVGDTGTTLGIALAAVALVLLIASANAANLLLARANQRRRELAVRTALGASRGQLLQHLFTESAWLALGGALAGLGIAVAGLGWVRSHGADYLPRVHEIGFGPPVVAFLLAVTAGSVILFGLMPALQGSSARANAALRSAIQLSGTTAQRRLRRALVAAQFAVAAPLLIGAGLLVGSLYQLQRVDPGFDPENLLTAGISLPGTSYPDEAATVSFWTEAIRRLEREPGIEAVALADGRPPSEVWQINNFNLMDRPTPAGESQPTGPWVAVTPGYFQAMGIPLQRGRLFEQRDVDEQARVVVVDQTWANRYYPGESPLGRQMQSGGCTSCPPITVVGVVADVKYQGLDQPGDGTTYWPFLISGHDTGFFVIRTSGDPLTAHSPLRRVVADLDPSLPLFRVATAQELIRESLGTPRYLSFLVGTFAAVALLLSIIGIYGVMSYFVQQHTRDIGIRLALGGGQARILGMVVGQGMRLVGIGLAAGVFGAFLLTRLLTSRLFGVAANDPGIFTAAALLMVITAALTCLLPAWRASRLDPARTLRED
ncbi:MAG: ABC transporter permease [Deltaproteobacteria bacterium]|nr:ABC transporter permease [Deltaproteobacteria bacterium]